MGQLLMKSDNFLVDIAEFKKYINRQHLRTYVTFIVVLRYLQNTLWQFKIVELCGHALLMYM